jgi:hypothetical protein
VDKVLSPLNRESRNMRHARADVRQQSLNRPGITGGSMSLVAMVVKVMPVQRRVTASPAWYSAARSS